MQEVNLFFTYIIRFAALVSCLWMSTSTQSIRNYLLWNSLPQSRPSPSLPGKYLAFFLNLFYFILHYLLLLYWLWEFSNLCVLFANFLSLVGAAVNCMEARMDYIERSLPYRNVTSDPYVYYRVSTSFCFTFCRSTCRLVSLFVKP